jgi:hypothetical protein
MPREAGQLRVLSALPDIFMLDSRLREINRILADVFVG